MTLQTANASHRQTANVDAVAAEVVIVPVEVDLVVVEVQEEEAEVLAREADPEAVTDHPNDELLNESRKTTSPGPRMQPPSWRSWATMQQLIVSDPTPSETPAATPNSTRNSPKYANSPIQPLQPPLVPLNFLLSSL